MYNKLKRNWIYLRNLSEIQNKNYWHILFLTEGYAWFFFYFVLNYFFDKYFEYGLDFYSKILKNKNKIMKKSFFLLFFMHILNFTLKKL